MGGIKHVRHLLPLPAICKFHHIEPFPIPLWHLYGCFDANGRCRSLSVRVSNAGGRKCLRESLGILWAAGAA